ncbi:MAG: histidine phosphatase family protein [Microscillaceae bacterium]|nr:histidine phosphatase family protein [Microscillaceae bacterium]
MLDIYLIRHAESTGNIQPHIIGGRSNHLQLTAKGEKQAELLGKRLITQGFSFDKVYASVAVRAIETARIACNQMDFPVGEIKIQPDIVELCQGEWTGRLREETYTEQVMKIIHEDPWNFKAPGGESQKEVEERIFDWLEMEILPHFEQNLKIAIFSHGVAIKCLVRKITEANPAMTYRIFIENTSITQFCFDERGWHLRRLNDYGHLEMLTQDLEK